MKLIVLCSPEHLPTYTNDKLKDEELAFGLNLSVATENDRPANDDLLKPWKWPQISQVMVYAEFQEDPSKPPKTRAYANVPIKPLTSWLGQKMDEPLQPGQLTKRQLICKEFMQGLDREFNECANQAAAQPFAWRFGDPSQLNKQVRHWHTIVGQTAMLPSPLPQSLNLSFFLRLKRDDILKPGAKVFIAPIIPDDNVESICPLSNPLCRPTNSPPSTPNPPSLFPCALRPQDPGSNPLLPYNNNQTVRQWDYLVPANCNLPPVVAYAALCEVEAPPPRTINAAKKDANSSLLDTKSLWIGKLLGGDADTFETDWRAGLEDRVAEAFDLSTPVIMWLRQYVSRNLAQADSALVRQGANWALAALRDLAGVGVSKDLGGQSLIERLRKRPFTQTPDERQQLNAAVKARLENLAQWRVVLGNLPDAAGLKLLDAGQPALTAAEIVNQLEQVQRIALDTQRLPALVKAQWEELRQAGVLADSKDLADKLNQAIQSKALNLRRQLSLENLGHVWPLLLKAAQGETTNHSGQRLIKQYLPGFLCAYFCKRFGLPLSKLDDLKLDPDVVAKLADYGNGYQPQYPLVESIPDSLQNDLLVAIKTWGENFAKEILPAQTAATAVPHALTLQVDKLDAPSEGQLDPRHDLLTRISGVGLLLREVGGDWRCLNMATASATASTSDATQPDETLVLAPVRLNYQNELRQAFVTYNNHPLSARSPVAEMSRVPFSHIPDIRDDIRKALVDYGYPRSTAHAELTKLTPLKFGGNYEALPFIVSTCGALPVELARGDNTPWEIDLNKFNQEWRKPQSWPAVRVKVRAGSDSQKPGIAYRRKVRIGQLRAFDYQQAQVQEQSGSRLLPKLDLKVPAIPANVYPRAREMGQVTLDNKPNEHPLLLLADAGWERAGGRSKFEFYLRLPATDLNTWDRWVANDAGSALLRKGVWANFYRRSEIPAQDTSIDDPALAPLFFAELYTCDGAQPLRTLKTAWIGVPSALWPDPQANTLDAVQHGKVQVICQHDASVTDLRSDEQRHELNVKVAKGGVYCLALYACLPKANDVRFANSEILAPSKLVKHPQTNQNYLAVAPFHFIIEAATDELIKGMQADDAADTLWRSLTPVFTQGVITARLNTAADDKFYYLHRAELLRQVWRWQGRETAPHPDVFSKETTFWKKPDDTQPTEEEKRGLWEAHEFGARPDTDYLAVNMEASPPSPRGSLSYSYREVLEFASQIGANPQRPPKAGTDDELRALHYRFSARAHSRYAGIMPDTVLAALIAKDKTTNDIWHSLFVPCRVRGPIPPPKVKFVLPLTETAEHAVSHTPGVIVVCHGAWHEVGGLGEWLRAEIELVDYKNGDVKEQYYELGPDPLLAAPATGHQKDKPKICLAAQEIRGPMGHTFDRTGDAPLFSSTSFIIPAPVISGQELAWNFCKMKFQRVVTVRNGQRFGAGCDANPETVELVSEPTHPFWVQFLPPFSLLSDHKTRDLRLEAVGGTNFLRFIQRADNQPFNLPTRHRDGFVTFESYLVVTRKVFDVIGKPDQETFVGVFHPAAELGRWAAMERAQPPSFDMNDPLRARIIEVQRHGAPNEYFQNEDKFWQALFAEGEADPPSTNQTAARNPRARIADSARARITRVSEPVESRVAEPPAC